MQSVLLFSRSSRCRLTTDIHRSTSSTRKQHRSAFCGPPCGRVCRPLCIRIACRLINASFGGWRTPSGAAMWLWG